MSASGTIRDAVSAAVAGSHGGIRTWSDPETRPWSWQFRAETGRGPLLIKVPRWEGVDSLDDALAAGPQSDTVGEFAALGDIAELVADANDPRLGAVVPVAHVTAVNAIVMEVFPGASLRKRLGVGAPSAAAIWFDRLGALLGRYHRRHGGAESPYPVDVEIERWRQAEVRHPRLQQLVRIASDAARRLSGHQVVETTQHGDLTLGNVLVSPDDRVALIDPNRTRGSAEADVARLLAELRLGKRQLLSLGLWRPPRVIAGWERAFAAAHGSLDPAVLAYECGAEALARRMALDAGASTTRVVGSVSSRMFDAEIRRRFPVA